jgi:hypothetical protein
MGYSAWPLTENIIEISSFLGNPAIIDSVFIENNVMTTNGVAPERAIAIDLNPNAITSNVYIRNNVIEGSNWPGVWGTVLHVDSTQGTVNGLHVNNNVLYNNGNSNNPIYGSNVANYEFNNNLKTNPLFVDAGNGNFHLQSGSAAINSGVNIGLIRDYLGNFIKGNPDIGAIEVQ